MLSSLLATDGGRFLRKVQDLPDEPAAVDLSLPAAAYRKLIASKSRYVNRKNHTSGLVMSLVQNQLIDFRLVGKSNKIYMFTLCITQVFSIDLGDVLLTFPKVYGNHPYLQCSISYSTSHRHNNSSHTCLTRLPIKHSSIVI